MKIKVVRCSDSRLWYSKIIGEILYVRRIDSDRWWVKELDEYQGWNFILFTDAIVYKE